ncbi:uncharacterized protein LAESUDRAFT_814283 [Laetiporus sulphureus 93-53]|uniref:Uncharacterized protein n=1 Tax=Laetiporus sulphureus 93-53 TaxID=1314785 RepID=A0A165D2K0_9APHY|nr:uncharacterized protein LAESUDRAFT_814283 [Laetiporus sulphureus 93-53]KZT04029.1 hypothetical protein LAESUDRAFT_814283 [Laetiporus sulphureus 93-53]
MVPFVFLPTDAVEPTELTLEDDTKVRIEPGSKRIHFAPQSIETLVNIARLDEKHTDLTGIRSVEDVFNFLMGQVEAMRLLVCYLSANQREHLKRIESLSKSIDENFKSVKESSTVIERIALNASSAVSGFERRLRAVLNGFQKLNNNNSAKQPIVQGPLAGLTASLLQDSRAPPTVMSESLAREGLELQGQIRISGTNWYADAATDQAFPDVLKEVDLAMRLEKVARESGADAAETTSALNDRESAERTTSLDNEYIKVCIEKIVGTHDEARQMLQEVHATDAVVDDRLKAAENLNEQTFSKHWEKSENAVATITSSMKIVKQLTPHMEEAEALFKELQPASDPVGEGGPGPSTVAAQTAQAATSKEPIEGEAADKDASKAGPSIYRLQLSIPSKPVGQLTLSEIIQILTAFPLRITFDPENLPLVTPIAGTPQRETAEQSEKTVQPRQALAQPNPDDFHYDFDYDELLQYPQSASGAYVPPPRRSRRLRDEKGKARADNGTRTAIPYSPTARLPVQPRAWDLADAKGHGATQVLSPVTKEAALPLPDKGNKRRTRKTTGGAVELPAVAKPSRRKRQRVNGDDTEDRPAAQKEGPRPKRRRVR